MMGAICLVVGISLSLWGRKIADSFDSQVQRVFAGAPTDRATCFCIGGLLLALAGMAQLFWKRQ